MAKDTDFVVLESLKEKRGIVPVEQFWSLTLYSENTRRPYDNGGSEIRSVNLDTTMTRRLVSSATS